MTVMHGIYTGVRYGGTSGIYSIQHQIPPSLFPDGLLTLCLSGVSNAILVETVMNSEIKQYCSCSHY